MPVSKIILSRGLRDDKLRADPTCSKCGITKTFPADFYPNRVDYWCRTCVRDYAIALWRKRRTALPPQELADEKAAINVRQKRRRADLIDGMLPIELVIWRNQINEGNTTRRHAVRNEVFLAYGGYVCACCKETEPDFLSIDHIENDGAAHKREFKLKTGEQMYRWLKRNSFPPGFQVLCKNCNWGKRNNGGVCPHQGKVQRSSREGVGPSGPKRSAPWPKPYSKKPRVMI